MQTSDREQTRQDGQNSGYKRVRRSNAFRGKPRNKSRNRHRSLSPDPTPSSFLFLSFFISTPNLLAVSLLLLLRPAQPSPFLSSSSALLPTGFISSLLTLFLSHVVLLHSVVFVAVLIFSYKRKIKEKNGCFLVTSSLELFCCISRRDYLNWLTLLDLSWSFEWLWAQNLIKIINDQHPGYRLKSKKPGLALLIAAWIKLYL
ncbi:hypothetical protein EJ110_NYTH18372 [Nymphaea thermarum]|nr:hypothetical protein EJ110_NYTH18372 [Nymphaea thermarum]